MDKRFIYIGLLILAVLVLPGLTNTGSLFSTGGPQNNQLSRVGTSAWANGQPIDIFLGSISNGGEAYVLIDPTVLTFDDKTPYTNINDNPSFSITKIGAATCNVIGPGQPNQGDLKCSVPAVQSTTGIYYDIVKISFAQNLAPGAHTLDIYSTHNQVGADAVSFSSNQFTILSGISVCKTQTGAIEAPNNGFCSFQANSQCAPGQLTNGYSCGYSTNSTSILGSGPVINYVCPDGFVFNSTFGLCNYYPAVQYVCSSGTYNPGTGFCTVTADVQYFQPSGSNPLSFLGGLGMGLVLLVIGVAAAYYLSRKR